MTSASCFLTIRLEITWLTVDCTTTDEIAAVFAVVGDPRRGRGVQASRGVHLVDRGHPAGQRRRAHRQPRDAGLRRGRLRDVVREHDRGRRQRGVAAGAGPGGEPPPPAAASVHDQPRVLGGQGRRPPCQPPGPVVHSAVPRHRPAMSVRHPQLMASHRSGRSTPPTPSMATVGPGPGRSTGSLSPTGHLRRPRVAAGRSEFNPRVP